MTVYINLDPVTKRSKLPRRGGKCRLHNVENAPSLANQRPIAVRIFWMLHRRSR